MTIPGSTSACASWICLSYRAHPPRPATTQDEVTNLRITRDGEAGAARCRKILADREIEADHGRDVLAVVTGLRDQVAPPPGVPPPLHALPCRFPAPPPLSAP